MMRPFNRSLKRLQYKSAATLGLADDPVVDFARLILLDRIKVHGDGVLLQDVKAPIQRALIYSNEWSISSTLGDAVHAGFSFSNPSGGNVVECDEENMPFKDDSFDCCVSFLALQWSNDIHRTFKEYYRILRKDHLLMGCLFGSGTLAELHHRLCSEQANAGGFKDFLSPTASPKVVSDSLQQSGFKNIVVDVDSASCTYDSFKSVACHLRRLALTSCSISLYCFC